MSEYLRISGKKCPLPPSSGNSSEKIEWEFRPGGWWIAKLPDGRRIRFMAHEQRTQLSFCHEGRAYSGQLQQESRHSAAAGGGESDLTAQFPGKVRKILVEEGAPVTEGTPLVLVEAMKMEFTVKAPFTGVIRKIRVAAGQQLSPGDVFLEMEEQGSGPGEQNGTQ